MIFAVWGVKASDGAADRTLPSAAAKLQEALVAAGVSHEVNSFLDTDTACMNDPLCVGGGIVLAGAATELARGIFGGGDFAAADLFDAHCAGYEEALEDVGAYEAGYDDAVFDLGDDLSGGDLDFGWDDR
jgi:hypothetical protein